jgi:exonuclease SbcC
LLKREKENEYKNVGPYLNSIFRKLSRDPYVTDIKLDAGRGDKSSTLNLVDGAGNPVLNMLSDGQLSVFMLSYFLGNLYRRASSDKLKAYFIDDITSCMDDINMLAFLDFIKYQLLANPAQGAAIDQLFFATCDSRILELLRYKLDNCGIDYTEINATAFSALAP